MIVALVGPKRCGKDAVASVMAGMGFTRMQLARPLKEGLKAMLGLTEDEVEGDAKDCVHPRLGVSPRVLMQTLGTEVMKSLVGPDVWVDQLVRRIRDLPSDERIVVTDMRFVREAEVLRREFGDRVSVVRVVRPGTGVGDAHVSENEYTRVVPDQLLTNDGTLDDLADRVRAMF